jgi:hypothetical protein
MRSPRIVLLFAVAALLGSVLGCAAPAGDAETSDSTAAPSLKAHIPALTVDVDLYVHPETSGGHEAWVVHGRTSRNLSGARSFDEDGAIGSATTPSPRVFEASFGAADMAKLAEGQRLFVELDVAGAAPVAAALSFAPRLRNFTGSSKLYALETMRPVLVGSEVLFRGTLGVAAGVTKIAVTGPLGPADAITATGAHEYAFDFDGASLLYAARAPSATVSFTAKSAGATVEKDGALSIDVASIDLTTGDPVAAFPDPPCDPDVSACLDALPASDDDTGGCGTVQEVRACDGD